MMRLRTVLAIAVLAVSGEAALAQQTQVAARTPGGGRATLDQYDSNQDGRITRSEFLAYQGRRFSMLDANADGTVSRGEFGVVGKSAKAKRREGQFRSYDADKNGQISRSEWTRWAERGFRRLDRDGNGQRTAAKPTRKNLASGLVREKPARAKKSPRG
jgi:Ca2+-binding EF-hand superfamily protein